MSRNKQCADPVHWAAHSFSPCSARFHFCMGIQSMKMCLNLNTWPQVSFDYTIVKYTQLL